MQNCRTYPLRETIDLIEVRSIRIHLLGWESTWKSVAEGTLGVEDPSLGSLVIE